MFHVSEKNLVLLYEHRNRRSVAKKFGEEKMKKKISKEDRERACEWFSST